MLTPINDLVHSYCQQKIESQSECEKLAETISHCLKALPPVERWTMMQKINREFTQKQSDPQKVELLKQALCGENGWRKNLLDVHYEVIADCSYEFLSYSNHLNQPLNQQDRTLFFSNQSMCRLQGSTFATNKPQCLNQQGHHLLDALYACKCGPDNSSIVLTLADGAGGHLNDARQDANIAQAAHCGTKTCARLFAGYNEPEELSHHLPSIIAAIATEIRQKAGGEGTTLVGCRAFPTDEGFRLVGFNLGDGMLVAWHPPTQTVYQIFSANVSEGGVAFFPGAYRAHEIQTTDTLLPDGAILFLMSDGIHNHLPYTKTKDFYPNGLGYESRTLTDLAAILSPIAPDAPVETYLRTLVHACFTTAEHERQQYNRASIQMGDDISILQYHLTKTS